MSGQWAGSDRRSRLPTDWSQIRNRRLQLDGHRCQWRASPSEPICGAPANQVDHIKAKTDDHRLEALQSLCEPHHKSKSAREGAAAFHSKRRKIKTDFNQGRNQPHPGAITPGDPGVPGDPVPYPWKLLARPSPLAGHSLADAVSTVVDASASTL